MNFVPELVALYDDAGRPCGVADRARVRAENLRHAATAVVVRRSTGEAYVHRRTQTKDVYPGLYDFCAGGVLQAGEEPRASAEREVAEELGVGGVQLEPLGEDDYADEHTRYHAYLYTCTYDGPVTWQPEEVAWGAWVTPERLAEMLRTLPFVPDSTALLGHRVLA
ncbi:NUDIX hydrolase [Isoptericola variabilis]|uniref:NUDIX hydrolase n=1 Tax=Isoptericola variabilis (strain 225) TaxID=743718 RepID=F6FUK0_ISOV2|nr:NUDIX hydrolase [Isoptericola variabilis 225]TWH31551.1 isopentenyldiphosphate isomerase [Isoptericola variabilis J7]